MSYRTHGEYIYDHIHRLSVDGARCVRRTPPWGVSNTRASEILAAASPYNAAMIADGRNPDRWYINKGFSVVRLDSEGPLPYGVLYHHDGRWVWFRANAAWVRALSSLVLPRCKVREDFPEVFEGVAL